MASNYRKSFNFKNGVQVDTDNFIVAGSMVGIGTTIPRQFLDVYGNDSGAVQVQGQVKVSGLTTTAKLYAGIGTIDNLTGTASSIGIGTFDRLQVGNSPTVNNLIGYAYTAWITDDGGIGLRTDSVVGIGTTTDSNYNLLIGSLPTVAGVDGIGFKDGDIRATGVITAPTFVGSLTGLAVSATTLETARDFQITGDLEGAAISFDGSANVSIASTLSSSFSAETTGIITANTLSGILTASSGYIETATVKDLTQVTGGIATFLNIDGSYGNFDNLDVGIGTAQEFTVKDDDSNTTLRVNNDTTSIISIGKSEPQGNQSAQIKYNDSDTTLQIANYDIGGVDVLLHEGTSGINTGGFRVKHENVIATHLTYDGRVSIGKNDPATGYTLDVNGLSQTQGLKVVGIITLTSLNGQSEYTLDPTNPLQLQGDNFNIASGISTLNDLRVIGTITQENPELTVGTLDLGNSKYGNAVIGIGTSSTTIGYLSNDPNPNEPYKIFFNRSNVQVDGIATITKIVAGDAFLNMNAVGGAATHFSGNIDNTYNSRCTKLGITTVTGNFIVGPYENPAHAHGDFGPDVRLGITNGLIDGDGRVIAGGLAVTGTGSGYTNGTYTATATTGGNGNGLTVTLTVASGTFSEVTVVDGGQNYNVGDVITIPAAGGGTGLTVTVSEINGQVAQVLFTRQGTHIGIGTTNVGEFHTPGYNGIVKNTNFLFDRDTVTTTTGLLKICRSEFQTNLSSSGPLATERDLADPRGSTDNRPPTSPHFSYGENLDIDTKTSTMVFDGSLSLVPAPGQAAGSGGSIWTAGIIPDYTGRQNDPNTGDSNNTRLTMVGINTYIPRCLLDVGASSPSMNSYMILPTLTQTDINIVKNLWDDNVYDTNQAGHDNAKRLTPEGIPKGAILYNSTTDKVQVRNTANSFRDLYSSVSSSIQTITNGDTEVVFNDVPAWANKITIVYLNVSHAHTPGNKHFRVQLGTSSGFIAANYDSESNQGNGSATPGYIDIADGFAIWGATNVATFSGHQTITKFDDTTYVETHILSPGATSTNGISHGGGMLHSVGDTITRLRIDMHDGSTQFSGGKIKVLYEG